MQPDRIPLFPLNVVLLPGGELPLHIFEPRYREMVRNCLEQKSEFGMLLSLPKGLARLGCAAKIVEVLNRQQDGSLDILTTGGAPFRVLELFTKLPLLEGLVEYLEDRDNLPNPSIYKELIELYETCHTLIFRDYPKNLPGEPAQKVSYAIASALPLELAWKQQILESRSESDRQARLVAYLREWAPHLEKVAALRQFSRGNGHGLN
jgi:ATP-dependent Lon protease